jgi:hypothetical protein
MSLVATNPTKIWVNELAHTKLSTLITPVPKFRAFLPFNVVCEIVPELGTALYPVPDLSLHALTDDDVPVIDDVSAPSNHNAKPGMDCGENPHTDFRDEVIDAAIYPPSYLV